MSRISFFLLLLAAPPCFSQNPLEKQWDYRFGGTSPEKLYSIRASLDNGFVLAGWSESGMDGDKSQPSWGGFDYWIVKTDLLGSLQWEKRFGGTDDDFARSIFQTKDAGYILCGHTSSGISGDKTEPSWGYYDYWIVKMDSLGNYEWDKRFGGTEYEHCYAVCQTSDGGYILGGDSGSGVSGDKTEPSWGETDYWIVKINSVGNYEWDKRFGGSKEDYCYQIEQTADGGYLLGGDSESGISGDKTVPSFGNFDYWVVKIDSLGKNGTKDMADQKRTFYIHYTKRLIMVTSWEEYLIQVSVGISLSPPGAMMITGSLKQIH